MKKLLLLLILTMPLTSLFAQRNSAAIKLGYFNPESAEGGFIIGYEGGRMIDRNFELGWSVDWFHKSYVDKQLVHELNTYYGTNFLINEIRAKTDIHSIPIMVTMTAFLQMNRRSGFYITGGIGGELLLINYNDFYNPNEDDLETAFDFAWRAGAGMNFRLGRRSEIFTEVTYHHSEPSWEYEVEDSRGFVRVFEREYDMSGLIVRGGVRFYF